MLAFRATAGLFVTEHSAVRQNLKLFAAARLKSPGDKPMVEMASGGAYD
jgi:hypothetical protein